MKPGRRYIQQFYAFTPSNMPGYTNPAFGSKTKKGIPTYPTTSNVFANDVHRTSSPMLNRPLTITFLNPTATFSEHINQNSLVLKMTYRSVSFLFMGDAHADAENRIVNCGTNLQADILKIGHHGSATSTSSVFLTKVHPKISVIEVGAGNSYGHPTSATLGRLAQVGSSVYRTDLNGDVTVTTDELRQRVWCLQKR